VLKKVICIPKARNTNTTLLRHRFVVLYEIYLNIAKRSVETVDQLLQQFPLMLLMQKKLVLTNILFSNHGTSQANGVVI